MACVAYPLRAPVVPRTFRPGALAIHFAKHAHEWPHAMTQDDYLRRARELLSSPIGGTVLGYVRENGDVVRYNFATGEHAVMSVTGTIRTFFRRNTGFRR